ncbi:glycosyltransferase [bacterium]|nr:glycosyltransferase [bacterium]
MFDATIVLLTCNGEKFLAQVLEMLRRQKLPPKEILAIDSGSIDSTLKVLETNGIPVKQISQSEFSHSGTRNLAARMSSTRYLVFLTQDATPADNCWLECLLRPFQEYPDVAGVFSRQVARPDADPLEKNDIGLDFPSSRAIKNIAPETPFDRKNIWHSIKFSNSSSAYDLQILLKHPFDERLSIVEDQEWAKRMLEQGYTIVYEPDSVVLHSHSHTIAQKFKRQREMGSAFSSFLQSRLGKRSIALETGAWLGHVYLDVKFCLRSNISFWSKCKWLSLSPLHRAVIHYGFHKGWNKVQPNQQLQAVHSRPEV